MNVKDSLSNQFDKYKKDNIINAKSESVDENYILQPINPCNEFNPLTNDSKTECYHNVAHQIYIKI